METANAIKSDSFQLNRRLLAMFSFIDENDQIVVNVNSDNTGLGKMLDGNVKYFSIRWSQEKATVPLHEYVKQTIPDTDCDVVLLNDFLKEDISIGDLAKFLCLKFRKIVIPIHFDSDFYYHHLNKADIIQDFLSNGFIMTGKEDVDRDNRIIVVCFERMTPEVLHKNISCTGCGACANTCSQKAIDMIYDRNGYLKPLVKMESCIECMKCVNVCTAVKPNKTFNDSEPKCYAVWASDLIRQKSSSGGAFTVIAEHVLKKGGHVFGVKWNQTFTPVFTEITDCRDLVFINHSKYAQSETGYSYQRVRELLQNNELVCFSGCPCQIAGLKSYLGKLGESNYLITIDLLCFYVPSNRLLQKYLEENWGISNIAQINFRDKSNGQGTSGYRVDLKNGDVLYPEALNDRYHTAFHNVLLKNDVCDNCRFAALPRVGDITLGDFWGISEHDSTWDDHKGTSLLLVNNQKAFDLISLIQKQFARMEEVPLEWALHSGNVVDGVKRRAHSNAGYFKRLISINDFNTAVKKAISNQHDIGLVGMYNKNIGNNLTNYALYRFLNDAGYHVLLIGQPSDSTLDCDDRKEGLFLKCPYPKEDYIQNKIHHHRMYELNLLCDIFVVGSDQVLRTSIAAGNQYHAGLDWVNDNKLKVAYSSSFGLDYFDGTENDIERMGYYLRRFDAISLREQSGVNLLKERYDIDAELVLDPVFICEKVHFDKMAKQGKMRIPCNPYTCAYILDPNPERAFMVNQLAKQRTAGCAKSILEDGKYDHLSFDWEIETLLQPSNEEWLSHICYCDYFITDSFHGVCFALIYNKQFIVVHNKWQWRGYTRITSLLNMLSLEDRLVGNWQEVLDKDLLHKDIDYQRVNELLKTKKEHSIRWLFDSLKIEKEKNSFSAHDAYQAELSSLYDSNCKEVCEMNKRILKMETELEGVISSTPYRIMSKLYPLKQKLWKKRKK